MNIEILLNQKKLVQMECQSLWWRHTHSCSRTNAMMDVRKIPTDKSGRWNIRTELILSVLDDLLSQKL